MPGLVPGIHVFLSRAMKHVVDGRDKPGHDEELHGAHSVSTFSRRLLARGIEPGIDAALEAREGFQALLVHER